MTDVITPMAHCGASDLVAKVEDALSQAGFGDGPISWELLAPLDQFHVGGAAATSDPATKLVIEPGAMLWT